MTTLLDEDTMCLDVSQQWCREQCRTTMEKQTARKVILFHQLCWLCHWGWHVSMVSFFSLFYKKHCVLSWEGLLHLMQETGDLAALMLCNGLNFAIPNFSSSLNLLMVLAVKILNSVWQLTICKRGHKCILTFGAFTVSLIRFILSLRILIKGIT